MTPDPDQDSARHRAEFRAYVRKNHPDVGGDPELFIAGLARFDRPREPADTVGEAATAAEFDRFDAPVVFVSRPAGLTGRLREWRRRRRRPPRVS